MSKVMPLGDRLLVKRKKIGATAGKDSLIELPENVQERPTDLAYVVHVPEQSFADRELINSSSAIVNSQTKKAAQGDPAALEALMKFNMFLKHKSIQVGDLVMISKYVGTDFHDTENPDELTLVREEDIVAIIKGERKESVVEKAEEVVNV